MSWIRRHPARALAALVPAVVVTALAGWYLGSPLILSSSIDEPAPIVAAAASVGPAMVPTPRSAKSASPAEPSVRPAQPSVRPAQPSVRPALSAIGSFVGSDEFHFGRGTAHLIETAPGTFTVRLQDFAVRNGPDLYVYLSPDASGSVVGAIELGRLKADRGNQNYVVPAGALDDPTRAASVVIWCKQFSHLFATAAFETS